MPQMIDGLQNLPNTKIYGSYILHIAASPPDNSQRPLWNDSIAMDDMDWKSLPDELKKVIVVCVIPSDRFLKEFLFAEEHLI